MSFHTWHVYGYGVKVSDIKFDSIERLQALIHLAPELERNVEQWRVDNDVKISSVQDYYEYDEYEGLELAAIMKEVILEVEGIELTACSDFDNEIYLLYEQTYPWYLQDNEKDLTAEKLKEVLLKYFSLITDDPVEVDYYDPANGG